MSIGLVDIDRIMDTKKSRWRGDAAC